MVSEKFVEMKIFSENVALFFYEVARDNLLVFD